MAASTKKRARFERRGDNDQIDLFVRQNALNACFKLTSWFGLWSRRFASKIGK
jgi:hypothetical protein